MSNPRFSIIMPLYNHRPYVASALKSALSQTFTDFEVIVCDDGSTDTSREAVLEVEDPRITLISKSNGGTVSALNACLLKSRGDLICWLSADDLFSKDKLQLHHQAHLNDDITVSIAPYGYIRDGIKYSRTQVIPTKKNLLTRFITNNYINGLSVCVRRDLFIHHGLFDPRYVFAHDVDRWIEIFGNYEPIFLDGPPASFTRLNTGGSSQFNAPLLGTLDSAKILVSRLTSGLESFFPKHHNFDYEARKSFLIHIFEFGSGSTNLLYRLGFQDVFTQAIANFVMRFDLVDWLIKNSAKMNLAVDASRLVEAVRIALERPILELRGEITFYEKLISMKKLDKSLDLAIQATLDHYLQKTIRSRS
jgi:teichuronic acid biosynthesis glycosyltransferase TuaG